MAGFYPDVPGFRFEYDRDGSICTWSGSTATVAEMQATNDEYGGGIGAGTASITCAWPEVRTVTGMFMAVQHGVSYADAASIDISADTTNGLDGTWTSTGQFLWENVLAWAGPGPSTTPDWCRRLGSTTPYSGGTAGGVTGWMPLSFPSIRGVRLNPVYRGGLTLWAWHIYGHWPTTENPNRLVLCDGSGATVTNGAYFDFGDTPRNTTATIPFRIKNISSSLTANSITVSFQALYDAAPSLIGQYEFSTGGSTYYTSHNIGSLSPGSSTGTFQLRRTTSLGAAVGPWQLRLIAQPASMT